MRRIASIVRFDLTNATRDSMVIYILAAPVILAVGLALLLPAFQAATITIAVDAAAPGGASLADALEPYGSVERVSGESELRARILRPDDATGFFIGSDGPRIVLQGDEDPAAAGLAAAILASALGGPEAGYTRLERQGARSPFVDYSRVSLAMLSLLIGGVAAAFALVEEKESKATRAFAVTPLSSFEYFAARGIWAAAVGMAGALAGHAIMGPSGLPFWRFASAIAASVFMPLGVCLLVGGIANNQIQAVASLKIVMFAYLALPIASLFVPASWSFVFWVLPNYWMFKALEGAYVPGVDGFPAALAMTLVSGAALSIIMSAILAKRLSPRQASARSVSVRP